MKQFFKFMFASMVGFLLSIIIFLIISIIIILSVANSFNKEELVSINKNTILQIKLSEDISERAPNNPLKSFDFIKFTPQQGLGLYDILTSIAKAKTDSNIKGIYLDLSYVKTGFATIEDIRNALIDFKTSGKFILCYSESLTQAAYYIASVADKVYLYPEGFLELKGLNANILFLKGTLDKFGIEPQVIRHGKFKSAVEPLMLNKMSEENRMQTFKYMNNIFSHILNGIAKFRNINIDDLNDIVDNLKIQNANDAVKYKLVDKLLYKDEFYAELNKRLGQKENDKLEFISLQKYIKATKNLSTETSSTKDKLAIIYAFGDIIPGEGSEDNIGAERIAKAIKEARENKKIKAIVLRVNSPGGSALASDIIWREVVLTAKVKPIVSSMGDYAASGGYYLACGSTKIVAQSSTITGSIGVFGVILNNKKLLNDKLGITIDNVKTNKFADFGAFYRQMTPTEKIIAQNEVENIYKSFISKVSTGRHIPISYVDSIGQGRVWAGVDALQLKLIDQIGGLNDAINLAANLAHLKKYRITELPKQDEALTQIMKLISGEAETFFIKYQLGDNYSLYKDIQTIIKMNGVQARLPYSIELN